MGLPESRECFCLSVPLKIIGDLAPALGLVIVVLRPEFARRQANPTVFQFLDWH